MGSCFTKFTVYCEDLERRRPDSPSFWGASVEVELAFGKVLRRRRVEAGLTQERLAHEAELQRNYVSLMERGIHQPTITTLIKLAIPLGCTAAEIVDEVERIVADQRSTPAV